MKQKILKKMKSDVSSYEHIEADLDYYLDESIKEMTDIVKNKDVSTTVKLDIAYFRFLLYVKQNEDLTEAEMTMYKTALAEVKNAKFLEDSTTTTSKNRVVLVGQREIF